MAFFSKTMQREGGLLGGGDHPLQICIIGKLLHAITNEPQYNNSLISRELFTFWIDVEAMEN